MTRNKLKLKLSTRASKLNLIVIQYLRYAALHTCSVQRTCVCTEQKVGTAPIQNTFLLCTVHSNPKLKLMHLSYLFAAYSLDTVRTCLKRLCVENIGSDH